MGRINAKSIYHLTLYDLGKVVVTPKLPSWRYIYPMIAICRSLLNSCSPPPPPNRMVDIILSYTHSSRPSPQQKNGALWQPVWTLFATMGPATQHLLPISSTSPALSGDGCSSQVLVSVKSLWLSAPGRAKSLFSCFETNWFMIVLHDSIKSGKNWFPFHGVLQWINRNLCFSCLQWSEF